MINENNAYFSYVQHSSQHLPRTIHIPKVYNTYYDCLLDGYQKSLDKTKEIGKSETNKYQIYSKFGCMEIIVPPPKPKIKA